jgi:hypothetical protein
MTRFQEYRLSDLRQFGAQEIGRPLLLDGKRPQQPTSLLVAARI